MIYSPRRPRNFPMLRHKRMVCDGVWSTVGATSFDNRPLWLTVENNGGRPGFLPSCHEERRGRGAMTKLREMIASLPRDQV
jgi:hypothetical protein